MWWHQQLLSWLYSILQTCHKSKAHSPKPTRTKLAQQTSSNPKPTATNTSLSLPNHPTQPSKHRHRSSGIFIHCKRGPKERSPVGSCLVRGTSKPGRGITRNSNSLRSWSPGRLRTCRDLLCAVIFLRKTSLKYTVHVHSSIYQTKPGHMPPTHTRIPAGRFIQQLGFTPFWTPQPVVMNFWLSGMPGFQALFNDCHSEISVPGCSLRHPWCLWCAVCVLMFWIVLALL